MWLYEHEGKELFRKMDIPIPKGKVARSVEESVEIAREIGYPVAVKAQILGGGRGKAGGIKFADDEESLVSAVNSLLGSQIRGHEVRSVLIEEKLDIKRELFVGIILDRAEKAYTLLASKEGGVDVEELAKIPGLLIKHRVDPLRGLMPYEARKIAKGMGYSGKHMLALSSIILRLWNFVEKYDAILAEINPLVETSEGKFVAADSRVIVDDDSLFRQPELQEIARKRLGELPQDERLAKEWDIAYVALDGNIGVIGNGAGLVMATLDTIHSFGGRPANFLDIGGGASADKVSKALSILLENPRVEVVFINVLGGITRCDEVAKGIIGVMESKGIRKPIVVRMVGTREEEGRRLLLEHGIHVLNSMEEAAKKAVELVG